MRIVFVLECTNSIRNGTGASCFRFAQELAKRGHEIVMLGEELKPGETSPFFYYGVPHFKFPVFEGLIIKDGFNFVRCDVSTIYEAIEGADLVHLFIPFKLCSVARLIAEIQDVPVSSAFHLLPHNITAALHMVKWNFVNASIYLGFRNYLYDHVRHVHCPSEMTRQQLIEHKYKNNQFHVISNGITPYFHRIDVEKEESFKDKIVVAMSGRLAPEKRQDLIIKAVAQSKYNDKIQIILCGKGPSEKHYRKLAEKKGLANPLITKFCDQEELRKTLSYTDIYVHASDFEIEGISAIEALACGAVPVISNAKLCATKHFSLSEHSLFQHGSAKDLCAKIEYLIEHPQEKEALSLAYQEEGKKYHIEKMVDAMEEMFKAAVADHKAGLDPVQNRLRKKDLRKKRKICKTLLKNGTITEIPEEFR